MESYNIDEVKQCYDAVALEYSREFSNELDNKPYDRYILKRFSDSIDKNGLTLDVGTGSGHIGKFVFDNGVENIIGIDIAEKAIQIAKNKYPEIQFKVMSMLKTDFENESISGLICFYAIVHFTYIEIEKTIQEWNRILKLGGKGLISFFIGEDKSIRQEKWYNKEKGNATWNLFNLDKIIKMISDYSFIENEVVVRNSYRNVEYPSKRAYILFEKI
jgi:ubiquinone/menaquinone biosynthesis C-methylase UbiE